jgi:predicted lipid-binding transport protein (Tim44 family)
MSPHSPTPPRLAAALLLGGALACAPSVEDQAADRAAVQALLEAYLPALAQAYATGDADALAGMAAPKEMASVEKRVLDLAKEGRVLQPTFKSVTVEAVDRYQHSNAFVNTVEVWDLRVTSAGSDRVLSEELDQTSRARYQLKRTDEGDWLVLYRELVRADAQ